MPCHLPIYVQNTISQIGSSYHSSILLLFLIITLSPLLTPSTPTLPPLTPNSPLPLPLQWRGSYAPALWARPDPPPPIRCLLQVATHVTKTRLPHTLWYVHYSMHMLIFIMLCLLVVLFPCYCCVVCQPFAFANIQLIVTKTQYTSLYAVKPLSPTVPSPYLCLLLWEWITLNP